MGMSTTVKWVIAILVIGAAGYMLWWSGWLGSPGPAATNQTGAVANSQKTPAPAAPQNGMSATNDTSNPALVQDSAAIDAQMQGLSSDSGNIDSSLNDQAGPESY